MVNAVGFHSSLRLLVIVVLLTLHWSTRHEPRRVPVLVLSNIFTVMPESEVYLMHIRTLLDHFYYHKHGESIVRTSREFGGGPVLVFLIKCTTLTHLVGPQS